MTNPSPPESQNPIPERRRRPATGVTFDEMIAIIVAFSTIGTILFWSMGGKNSKLANNLGLGGGTSLLSSEETTDTGLGFGGILADDADVNASLGDQDLEQENRQLLTQLEEQDRAVASIPSTRTAEPPARTEAKKSFSLGSGAKLAPLAGVATLPALTGKSSKTDVAGQAPSETKNEIKSETETGESDIDAPPEVEAPVAATPETPAPEPAETTETAEVEPTPITPETTQMPDDIVPDYWAYPFVKQMRDKALVPELAKNQEFEPDTLITRASMATLVSQAFAGQPKIKSAKKFTDVSNKNAIAADIDQAVSTGFMQGYSDDEFKPQENIPRYQVLVTLATGLGLEPSQDADQILQQFGDGSDMPDWAKQQVAAATEAGLVVNPPDAPSGSLTPERSATRAEVAAMIHQALVKTGKLEAIESEYIVQP